MQIRGAQGCCRSHPLPMTPTVQFAASQYHRTQRGASLLRPALSRTTRFSRSSTHRHHHRFHISAAGVSGAAAFNIPSQQEVRQKAANRIKSHIPKPAQLPPPPKSTSLLDVLPYLTKLAVSDAQLYWRLGLAFVLMLASKAAGTRTSLVCYYWMCCTSTTL